VEDFEILEQQNQWSASKLAEVELSKNQVLVVLSF
jgi:hypothetical protein